MITWTDERSFVSEQGTSFLTMGNEGQFAYALATVTNVESTPDRFVLLKTRQAMDRYVDIIERVAPKRIVDVGVFRGGSVAMLGELARPEMLVAIEYEQEPVAALAAYVERAGATGSIRVEYGVDQGDKATVGRIIDEAFGTTELDLVIDDASHLGPSTRSTFEVLFPRLRPGGAYLIEDWSWHLQGLELGGETMESLLADLMAAAGRGPGLIAGIEVVWDAIILTRGDAPADWTSFSLEDWHQQVG